MSQETIEKITKHYGYSYINPFFCTFGIVCNIINLFVLSSRRLKESPYTYLTGLAVSDLLTLIFNFTTAFTRGHWIDYKNNPDTEYWLKKLDRSIFLPSANVFSALTVCITVALTVERYLFIKFPMHASSYCTTQNARIIMLIILVFVFLVRSPMYFFIDIKRTLVNNTLSTGGNLTYEIKLVRNYPDYQKLYFVLSFFIFEIVPFFILSILNLNLIILVKNSLKELQNYNSDDVSFRRKSMNKKYLSMTEFQDNSGSLNGAESSFLASKDQSLKTNDSNRNISNRESRSILKVCRSSRRKRDQLKLTRTLIAVVFFVILSEISSIVTYDKIAEFLIGRHIENYMKKIYPLQVFISNLIVLCVHFFNFFLYCAFNKKYVEVLKSKFALNKCSFLTRNKLYK